MSDTAAAVYFSVGINYFTKLIEGQRFRNWQRILLRFGQDEEFVTVISNHFKDYIQNSVFLSQHGENVASSTSANHENFRQILTVWRKFDNVLRDLFDSGKENAVIREILQRPFINIIRSLPTSFNMELRVAEHCHSLLLANGEEKQILHVSKHEELLHLVSLSKLLPESGAFIKAYHVMLAKRLLDSMPNESYHMECLMVRELYKQFSFEVLSLREVLRDFTVWEQYQVDITEWIRNCSDIIHESIVTEPKVVRSFYWPSLSDTALNLPKQLQKMEHVVKEFFRAEHPRKKTSVRSCAGRVIVKTFLWGNESSNGVRLSLTSGQMCILSQFEELDTMSIQDIMDALFTQNNGAGLSHYSSEYEKTVIALLKSMTEQFPIFKKEPASSEFETGHMIILNKEFKPDQALIKLPSPELFTRDGKEVKNDAELFTRDEKEVKKEDVPEPLQEAYIEAALMRILKDRLEVSKDELLNLVNRRLCMFTVRRDKIETCLLKLRDREFVEFDDEVIRYVP